MYRTYPHDTISKECSKKYSTRPDIQECVINSLSLYYGHTTEEELKKNGEKFVKI